MADFCLTQSVQDDMEKYRIRMRVVNLSTKISICRVLCNLSREQTEHFLCSINLLVRFERGRAYSSQGKSTSRALY